MDTQFTAIGDPYARPSRHLEVFNKPDGVTIIILNYDEMESLCPVEPFHHDLSKVEIVYAPDSTCLESKSLRLYFQTYRDEKLFCEQLASQISKDIFTALMPEWCIVTVIQKRRGGIEITSTARRP